MAWASNWCSSKCITPLLLPHVSLRQALTEPVPTNGRGSAKVWRPCTPAMAAGADRSCLELARSPAVPRAALAPANGSVSKEVVMGHRKGR